MSSHVRRVEVTRSWWPHLTTEEAELVTELAEAYAEGLISLGEWQRRTRALTREGGRREAAPLAPAARGRRLRPGVPAGRLRWLGGDSVTRVLRLAALAALAAVVAVVVPAPAAEAAPAWPVVFVVPHQDDELLSMGAAIRANVRAGRAVEVFLVTDGAATGACRVLGLGPAACSSARDVEFRRSVTRLGVPLANVHELIDPARGARFPDGGLDYAAAWRAYDVMAATVAARYPGARGVSWRSMSWTDNHPDHAVLGAVLRDRRAELGGDARFYLKDSQGNVAPAGTVGYVERVTTTIDVADVRNANLAYRQPQARYGIGYLSVRRAFHFAYVNADRSRAFRVLP